MAMLLPRPVLTLLLTCSFCHAGLIDNQLIDLPKVECVNDAIAFQFETQNPFNGRVYVRGLEDVVKCAKGPPSADQIDQTKFNITIKRGDCNMEKQRTEDGTAFSVVVIVSFHKAFETKRDAAFRGICFFPAAQKVAGTFHGVVGSLSVVNEKNARMPAQPFSARCTYTIRGETLDSPVVRYAKIGDTIHHVWECSITRRKKIGPNQGATGILVHSCRVSDGRGVEFALLDDRGCPLDEKIGMGRLVYENATINASTVLHLAYVRIWQYKFSQTTELRFRCVVSIYDRRQGIFEIPAPLACDDQVPAGIQNRKIDPVGELDVAADIHAFDRFDEQLGEEGVPGDFLGRLNREGDEVGTTRCMLNAQDTS